MVWGHTYLATKQLVKLPGAQVSNACEMRSGYFILKVIVNVLLSHRYSLVQFQFVAMALLEQLNQQQEHLILRVRGCAAICQLRVQELDVVK